MNKIQILKNLEVLLNKNFIEKDVFNKCKTIKGKTQKAEENYIDVIQSSLDELNLKYERASSQQSKDFRIQEPKINLEIKKSDKTLIFLNDTPPSQDIDYVCILTGNKKYKPQIKIINGSKFEAPWLDDYQKILESLKNIFCRGSEKKCKDTALKCYIRPTFSVELSYFVLEVN